MDEVLEANVTGTRAGAETPESAASKGQAQESTFIGSAVGGCDSGVGAGGGTGGGEPKRVLRAGRAGRTEFFTPSEWNFFVGGIIAQLIADAKTRLGEAKECVIWYQNVCDREMERLKVLEEMRDRAAQVLDAED